MSVATTCARGDLSIEIEDGHSLLTGDPSVDGRECMALAAALRHYREEYELRFGRVNLTNVTIRLRAADDLRTTGVESQFTVSGHTYGDAIDLAGAGLEAFPHELNHLRTGLGHDGWCLDYEPWSEEVLGINQRGYLGCQ